MKQKEDILISVIIPIYNVSEYLEQCLDSIISQSFKNIEIICIDDCSTDNSLEILKKYSSIDTRIQVFHNSENKGVSATRDSGLKIAKGDYIHFFDPDDWLEPEAYSSIIDTLKQHQDLDILFTSYNWYNNTTKESKKIEFPNKNILGQILNPKTDISAFDNWERMCWLKFIKRSFLLKNNINFDNRSSIVDFEWSAKTYVYADKLLYIDIPVNNYRASRPNSLVTTNRLNIKSFFQSCMNNQNLYANLPNDIKYRILAFDYYLINNKLKEAYKKGDINTYELFDMVKSINRGEDYKKYVFKFRDDYTDMNSCKNVFYLNFWKIFIKTHFPFTFNLFIKIKKILFNKIFKFF